MSALEDRGFLNRKGQGGLAAWRLYLDQEGSYRGNFVEISDCNRTVTLEFDLNRDSPESNDNAIDKARKLKNLFARLERELKAAREEVERG